MGLGIDDPIRMEARSCERWRKEIAPRKAPQHRPFVARQNAGYEQRRHSRMLARRASLHDLMERAERQATAGKMVVDLADAERKHSADARTPVDPLDAPAQLG
jgi:hypothetical protein